ncbi:50S ribosomal protein L22 [Spiroplasma endosymbiont of Anurida maritima]|uniref:50S ribosomal protein L22 n=1 Tax=Spiroplasma endosymbiont of Anurida maritima TaxID=2967972 RepID=UPI0036D36925
MEVKAHLKTIRISARKVRLVLDMVRDKKAGEAVIMLDNINKRAALPVKKLVSSAIANAVNNNGLDADTLYIKEIFASEGPTLKRFRPRAHGRAYEILKRTSHITVTVSDEVRKGR